MISPQVIRVARRHGVPVVATVHNFRMECLNGLFFRDGEPCHRCAGRALPWPGVTHGCYRGSRAQSAALAASQFVHRRTWPLVDRFFVMHPTSARFVESLGVAPERIVLKANPVVEPGGPISPPGRTFLSAGRLDHAKGTDLLLDAWERSGLDATERLVIAGDGPLRSLVEQTARRCRGIEVLGTVPHERVFAELEGARCVVVASRWDETFALTMWEALARGRPVVVADVNGLPDLLGRDLAWTGPPTADGLAGAMVAAATAGPDELADLGQRARARYEATCAPTRVADTLIATYRSLLDRDAASR
jgi:glycosyltransferase involved in cell wall biosynthesis